MDSPQLQPNLISILIVNWNTRDYLRACLRSIRRNCRDVAHEVIVVDNDSADSSAQMVREEFPEVLLIANPVNTGFAGGNNQAYQQARGEWIWLLNPDTEILGNAAEVLTGFLRSHPEIGAVASTLIDARDGRPQRSCRTFPTPAALWCEALGLSKRYARSRRFGFYRMGWWRYHDTRPVEQPQASSFLLRRAAIEQSGGLFDEDFPIFFNDVDLCWRLWQAGWPIWFVREAEVLHWGGASTSQVKPEMIESSHQALHRFYLKHWKSQLPSWQFAPTIALVGVSGWWRKRQAQRRQNVRPV
jgi:GT2 family glycosyltransferase